MGEGLLQQSLPTAERPTAALQELSPRKPHRFLIFPKKGIIIIQRLLGTLQKKDQKRIGRALKTHFRKRRTLHQKKRNLHGFRSELV